MRYSGRWMSIADDRVLEFLDESGPAAPKRMKEEGRIPYTRQYVAERCRTLADHGMIRPLGNGVYEITEVGEAYLAGELDASELAEDGDESSRLA